MKEARVKNLRAATARSKRMVRALGLLALMSIPALGQNIGTWTKSTTLPVIQSEWDGVTIGDSLFIVGGEMKRTPKTDPSKASDELWIFNGKTNTWTQGANMPGGRNHHSVAVLDGMMYVLGGYGFSCCGNYPWPYGTTSNWRYDPRTNAWKVLAPIPRRHGAGMAAAFGGKVYAFAGTDSGAFHSVSAVHEYDPATDTWKAKTSMKNAREHVKGAVVDSLIYLIGGHQKPASTKIDQPSVEAYSPRSDKWYDKGNMPVPRGGIGAAYLGGKIYVFGGEGANMALFNRVDSYDPATGQWAQVNVTPSGAGIHGLATMVLKGQVHLVGGASPAGFNPRDYHDVYTPPTVAGCTDPAAKNYNRYATQDDGTCQASSALGIPGPRNFQVSPINGAIRVSGLATGSYHIALLDPSGRILHETAIRGDACEIPLTRSRGINILRIKGEAGTVLRKVAAFR